MLVLKRIYSTSSMGIPGQLMKNEGGACSRKGSRAKLGQVVEVRHSSFHNPVEDKMGRTLLVADKTPQIELAGCTSQEMVVAVVDVALVEEGVGGSLLMLRQ